MDHLTRPRDGDPMIVKVPYIASDIASYDRKGFDSFPERQGYTISDPPRFTFEDLQQKPPSQSVPFVQAWLFFGLLSEVFGASYRQDFFIRWEEYEGFVSTASLAPLREEKLKSLPERWYWDDEGQLQHEQDESTFQERCRISRIVKVAALHCDSLDVELDHPAWPKVLFSIRLLVQSLDMLGMADAADGRHRFWLDRRCSFKHRFPHGAPSSLPIQNHMLRGGSTWCKPQFHQLRETVSCETLCYLANIKRKKRSWVDHQECESRGHCIGYNTNANTFRPAHVESDCSCSHIEAPLTQMHEILQTGGIPVVKCFTNLHGEITLSYVRASPGASYAAISHLWIDGLGNPGGNSIPRCQLKRLSQTITQSNAAVSLYPSLEKIHGIWVRQSARQLPVATMDGLRPSTTVYFWLDVYCVPVFELSPEGKERERLRRLKSIALAKMPATYSWADYTLVLDTELRGLAPLASINDSSSRVAISGWNSRFWTYHEYSMARLVVLESENGPFVARDAELHGLKDSTVESVYTQDQTVDLPAWTPTSAIEADLTKLLFRPRHMFEALGKLGKGHDEKLKAERDFNFVRMWNLLRMKSTTQGHDIIFILAQLLDLNAAEVMQLEPIDRMKAILKSLSSLPLDLLFIDVRRYICGCPHLHCAHAEDRLIPVYPLHAEELGGRRDSIMEPVPDGLLLRSSVLFPNNAAPFVLFRVFSPRQEGWTMHVENSVSGTTLQSNKLWVTLCLPKSKSRGLESLDEVILILNTTNSDYRSLTWRKGNGACLVPRLNDGGTLHTMYVCAIQWGPCAHDNRYRPRNLVRCRAESYRSSTTDILITSDIEGWPQLTIRPDQLLAKSWQLSLPLDRTFDRICFLTFCALIILAALAMPMGSLLYPNEDWDSEGNDHKFSFRKHVGIPILATVLSSVPLLMSWAVIVGLPPLAYKSAIMYIIMAKLSPDSRADDAWWQSLEKVLPGIRARDHVPNMTYKRVLIVLHSATWVASRWHAMSSWTRRRWSRKRTERDDPGAVEMGVRDPGLQQGQSGRVRDIISDGSVLHRRTPEPSATRTP